jgi:sulfur-oxidizing protein SoxY
MNRRQTLQAGLSASTLSLLLSAGIITPAQAQAQTNSKAAFDAKNVKDAIAALGAAPAAGGAKITITSPDIAENGAVVPVGVTSDLPGTTEIYILVEKNPNPLAAGFTIPDGTEANVQTRVKMGQSSNIHAVVKANGKLYAAVKETKVTLGGCGG